MDAKQFLAEFGLIVNAPGGLQRLREMILFLAASGDLMEADLSLNAYPLLKNIKEKKKAHKDQKKIVQPQRPVDECEIKAPSSWAKCRLGDLVLTITGGGTPSKNNPAYWNGDIPWASVKDLGDKTVLTDTIDKITLLGLKNSSSNLIPENSVIVCTRMGLGKIVVNTIPIAINQDLKAFELPEEVDRDFFLILYKTRKIKGKGTTVSGIRQNDLLALPTSLPVLEEQKRIVAKVDELMALCDKLEAQQQKRRKLQTLTRTTALDTLANAQSPHELKDAWLRVQSSFPLLFDGSVDVVDLKQTLRELAIIGHLSERTEEDVENYLRHLSKFKSAKRTAKLKEVESDIVLPKGWRWVLLEDLIHSSDSGWSPKCNPTPREKGEWGVLKVSAVTWGKFKSEENKALPLNLEARPEHEVKPLDFMLSRANTAELVAKSVIAPVDVPEKLMMSDKIIRLNFIDDDLKPWVNLVNNSRISREYYKQNATGTSDSMRNVSRKVIHELAVPLPSKSEQEKILEKLKYLDLYCDRLEKQFTKANKIAKNLAQAAIASITGTEIKEDLKMKAPKTELVSKLKLKVSPNNKDQAPLSAILAKHNGELSSKALWNYSGLEIDAFYQQLKTEMAREWIVEPEKSRMIEKDADNQSEAEAEI